MRKLFDWVILQTPQYKKLNIDYEYSINQYNELVEKKNQIAEENHNLKKILSEAESGIMTLEKYFKKIRTLVNKLDKKDENVKAIKQLIKEVL